ncbi:FecR family protein [Dongia rigui]|uniref:FecR family protein n=1 Tax=Dongia rigui TaxID=940149 RepID=A0ABU5E465_9PROT|nr:FecR family protein [Dongia rigui]MDY0874212.1 FecR family protein [Dongia rigui]
MKQKKLSRISLGVVALAVIAPAFATESRIGEVVQRQYNGAVAEPNGRTASHAIHFSDSVFALDTVRTDAAGSTALQFLDDTTVQLGSNAEVRLDSFAYDPSTTVGAAEISFTKGAFRYIGGKMTTEEDVRLHTPTATMVIRGTELVIYVWDDGRTEVNVVSGAVEVSGCGGKGSSLAMTGMQVTVLPNCSTKVAAARQLPDGYDALTLPKRNAPTYGGDGTDEGDNDHGRDPNSEGRSDPPAHEPPSNGGGGNSNGG